MESFKGKHFLTIKDFSRQEIDHIFDVAETLEPVALGREQSNLLKGKILTTLFFQPSTRTRLSFESAMMRLGGGIMGFASPEASRASGQFKESMADTARCINGYTDIVVMRHYEVGAPADYAKFSTVPMINAGDGQRGKGVHHPTQALIDLYTVRKERGVIDGLVFLISGDLNYRVNQSLANILTRYKNVKLYLIAPDELHYPDDTETYLREEGLNFEYIQRFEDVAKEVDVLYPQPTTQNYQEVMEDKYKYNLTRLKQCKDDLIVLHALPRLEELATDVDNSKYAKYWEEAHNGIPIRMALLSLLLGAIS